MTPFRFSWRRCVPGNDTAFVGADGKLQFGGIKLLTSGTNEGAWKYDLDGKHFAGYTVRGHVDGTAREAAAFL